jgi:hypothetical protein
MCRFVMALLPKPYSARNICTKLRLKKRLDDSTGFNDSKDIASPVVFYLIPTPAGVIKPLWR